MAFGNRPVASLSRRAVYKTEFDIFKQNTDIELISLISYEEHEPSHIVDARPKTVPQNSSRPGFGSSQTKGIQKRVNSTKGRNLLSAYDPTNRLNRQPGSADREFKQNIWNKKTNATSVYKDFAKTTRKFLKRRQEEIVRRKAGEHNRHCKSALDLRKHVANNSGVQSRSQTTCEFRPNERSWIKSAKTNRSDVSHDSTNNTGLNQYVNRTLRSPASKAWRTKSAPAAVQNINNFKHSEKQDWEQNCGKEYIGNIHQDDSDSDSTDSKLFKSDWKRTARNSDSSIPDNHRIEDSHTENSVYSDCLHHKCNYSTNTYFGIDEGNAHEQWGSNEVVENKNVTCIVIHDYEESEKKDSVGNYITSFDINGNQGSSNGSVSDIVHEECIGSRDSGFASNNVTPELGFSNKNIPLNPSANANEKPKHVKFKVESPINETNLSEEDFSFGDQEDINNSSEKESENAETLTNSQYNINTLISDLEQFGETGRLSVLSSGCHSRFSEERDNDSLCGGKAQTALKEAKEAEENAKVEKHKKEAIKSLESIVMSKEARYAILETLNDMGGLKNKGKNKPIGADDIRHKSVNAQRRQTDNRSKYEYYMRERTNTMLRNQFRSLDSVGNDENSSPYSSPREFKDCDDDSSDDHVKRKLFPSIKENIKNVKSTKYTHKKKVSNIEHTKTTKYKIPGIGNYQLIASPESDFEITPPGFDSRYNARPYISNEEQQEVPPKLIRERSIQKCKSWLNNVNMSPMALQPVRNLKE